ncbi:hypothetical protein ACLOJK_017991 [Asimina triloba]
MATKSGDYGNSKSARWYHMASFMEKDLARMTSFSDMQEKSERTCVRQVTGQVRHIRSPQRIRGGDNPIGVEYLEDPLSYLVVWGVDGETDRLDIVDDSFDKEATGSCSENM